MKMFAPVALACALLASAAPIAAQPVQVTTLAAPDLFSAAGRETGLPSDLWRDASPGVARTVFGVLAAKPLSPAGAALARRVLATGAEGPPGAGRDSALAGARVMALIAQGDPQAGAVILSRAAGLERDPDLARAAAEAALLTGDDERACLIAGGLGAGRDDIYWLRLRSWCQARRGDAAAQLTFDLAQAKAADPIFARLMAARLGGLAKPGPASLRNGLDYALSRELQLDLAGAKPAPGVAAAIAGAAPASATWTIAPGAGETHAGLEALAAGDLARAQQIRATITADAASAAALELALFDAGLAAAAGKPEPGVLERLVALGSGGDPKDRPRAQAAALYLAALGAPVGPEIRNAFAGLPLASGKAPAARLLALDEAAQARRTGETALVALWIAADAGAEGLGPGDRARIVRALNAGGLTADASAFALEGILTGK